MMYVKLALLAKKYWKPLLGGSIAFIMLVTAMPMILFISFMPGGEEEDISRYVEVANDLSISWIDLVAFDMVLYNNDLEDRNPNDSAYYFIELYYEEFQDAYDRCIAYDKGKCIQIEHVPEKVTYSKKIKGKSSIQNFFYNKGIYSDEISENIKKISNRSNVRLISIPLSIESAMQQANFSKKQEEQFNEIIEMGLIQEMYPQYASIGIIPGACVGNLSPNGIAKVNAKVQSYHSIIEKYARQFGMDPYIEIMKSMMMQESKGAGTDPMQASEAGDFNKKYPVRPNGIKDPDYSIFVGVQAFKQAMERTSMDIMVALQTYNFGPYFATWIKTNGGTYSLEAAQKYSIEYLYPNHGVKGTPSHAMKVASYYEDPGCQTDGSTGNPSIIGPNGWVWPTQSTRITSNFGPRTSPCTGCSSNHPAVDIGAVKAGVPGDPVWTMADGVVTSSGLITGGGNSVFVDHGNGVVSRYIHLNSRSVRKGQVVKKGDVIGAMGGTGGTRTNLVMNAYAIHLDFQIKINGTPVDPLKYFPNR